MRSSSGSWQTTSDSRFSGEMFEEREISILYLRSRLMIMSFSGVLSKIRRDENHWL